MSLVNVKQLKFPKENQIVIGSDKGSGKLLDAGVSGTYLKIVDGQIKWNVVDTITDSSQKNSITANSDGILFQTDNGRKANISLIPADNGMSLVVSGDATVVDLNLIPAEGGHVVIGGEGNSIIEADLDENLTISGGSGNGNLFLKAGAHGKVYYGEDASNPLNEVATIGTIRGDLSAAYQRLTYTGDKILKVPANAALTTLFVYLNGVMLDLIDYAVQDNNISITNPLYPIDATDTITLTYMGIA